MKSDVEELMPRLLPIEFGDNTDELNLNGPPRNPQEYLRQVQYDNLVFLDGVGTMHNMFTFSVAYKWTNEHHLSPFLFP